MSKINPVEKEIYVNKCINETNNLIRTQLRNMKGKIVNYNENYIECKLGSLAKSRIIGEFFVSKETLPKKAEIYLNPVNKDSTNVKILISDTHRFGIKIGYVKKYENALNDAANSIVSVVQ